MNWKCKCTKVNLPDSRFCERCGMLRQVNTNSSFVNNKRFFTVFGIFALFSIIATVVIMSFITPTLPQPKKSVVLPKTAPDSFTAKAVAPTPPITENQSKIKKSENQSKIKENINLPNPQRPIYTVPKKDSYYHLGPRGGCYVITSGGNKRYVDRSLCN